MDNNMILLILIAITTLTVVNSVVIAYLIRCNEIVKHFIASVVLHDVLTNHEEDLGGYKHD